MFHKITPKVPGLDRIWRTAQGTLQIAPPQFEASASNPILLYLNAAGAAGDTSTLHGSLRAPAYALYANGADAQYVGKFVGGSGTAGKSFGITVLGGTNATDYTARLRNRVNTLDYFALLGNGSGLLGYNGTTNTISWTVNGNVSIAACASGETFTAHTSSGLTSVNNDVVNVTYTQIRPNSGTKGWLAYTEDSVADRWAIGIKNGDATLYFSTGNVSALTDRVTLGGNGGITIVAPTVATDALVSTGAVGNYAATFNCAATTPRGVQIIGGSAAADLPFIVKNAGGGTNLFIIAGDGSGSAGASISWASAGNTTLSAPASGITLTITDSAGENTHLNSTGANGILTRWQNSGTDIGYIGASKAQFTGGALTDFAVQVNGAHNLVFGVNNSITLKLLGVTSPTIQGYGPVAAALVDMTPDTGTFTGSLTGFAANQNVSCHWVRMGNVVMLFIALTTAASTATTMTMTGLPAAIQPASSFTVPCILEDNSGIALDGANFTAASGTITFGKAIGFSGGFTASGTKGIAANQWLCYALT